MQFCRFIPTASKASEPRYGVVDGDRIREISAAPWRDWRETGATIAAGDVRRLAPVEPRKIVCIGRNYAAHAAELGNEVPKDPLIFLKPSTAVVGPDEPIVLPRYSQRVEHEGELGLVVGRRCLGRGLVRHHRARGDAAGDDQQERERRGEQGRAAQAERAAARRTPDSGG